MILGLRGAVMNSRRLICGILGGLAVSLSTTSALAQLAATSSELGPVTTATGAWLAGKWTYRSFHNNPVPVADDPRTAAEKALDLIFAEAVFTFELPSGTTLSGTIDWDGGGLDLHGTILPGAAGAGPSLEIVGTGRPGTHTAGWEYDYRGQLAYQWPSGVNQTPALVGTVIRAKPHNGSPAGYVASFIAVKRRD
jgi:hypothetical protein